MQSFYHGSQFQSVTYQQDTHGSDGEGFLFFSLSANVAKRYGPYLHRIELPVAHYPRITLSQWLDGDLPDDTFIVTGDKTSFDFPVDMLVLRDDTGDDIVPIHHEHCPDDGLAFKEPLTTNDRQWQLYVEDLYCGDADAWRRDVA